MAIKLTDNQIEFSNITVPGANMGALTNNAGYKDLSGNIIDDEYEGNIQQPSSFVNAVDIDWNGAKPGIGEGLTGINTTGELLSNIKEVYLPMFAN